ncbi:ABC transporter ATP-binding protein [Candidatus Bathyarchaeota archaeon]|jgi:putative ABC transport system ATP-binding protein|nr:ABC transporter ATP-binding protein [Candidatus Bathyarchaeota archaeon]
MDYPALRDVSLSIPKGEFAAIIGPSGSGKTTLLNLIGTLDKPTKGEVFLDGTPTSALRGNGLAELRNRKLGFVFQFFNLVPYLTAEENVQLPLVAMGVPTSKRSMKAKEVLNQLGLGDKVNKKPSELSGGEQQRVAIARALANEPPIVLADEPTGNLDTKSAENVASVLRTICEERGVTVIMVTHNLELSKYINRMVYLRDGSIERIVELA